MSERDDAHSDEVDGARDLAAGYALGSLTPEERARYEHLVGESDDAAREREQFSAVADVLNAAPPLAQPPSDLKARLMTQIAVTEQQSAQSEVGTDAGTVVDPDDAPPPPPRPSERRAAARWYRRPAAIVIAAAAAVVIFAGGAAVGFGISQHAVVSTQADSLAQITSAPDAQRATSPVTGGGTATLVWSESLGKSAMIVDGLSAAPDGHTYQLWYIRNGDATSAGLMSGAWQVLAGTLQKGDTVGLTVEPRGGSEQPTTKPVVTIVS
ncbi:anti-sigma factor [Humibacter soli]